ncbi:amidohydrolase family protein [Neorhizobium galegae]|uniref:5-methylthioadenosine/S-adenosylhomocysteine deaminase n=1 Tax=Neorhizobium galegae bv. officinalis TaxID=323656 RepID=A0A0T7GEC9_NEOGA|nr:amidohydrolase family protein [Neorhizobium galegae]CDZ45536.1 5-methylthioadenosine/S-adenosylhomocysteine deaminase [Neorhizobium galegae bv. officinalis]
MCRFCNNRMHAPAELGSGSGKIIVAPASMPVGVGDPDRLTLIRGGAVLSMDSGVGNFSKGDVLIRGSRIVEVAASITAPEAAVVDASGMVVMPGFVDTHHHQFETALRSLLADAILINDGRPESAANYYEWMLQKFSVLYRPQDVYISELFGGLSQIDAGVTTVMDVSQIHHSPEHSDAAITALRDAGRRGVFGYFEGWGDAAKYPGDARRIKAEHFASDDQLLTMVMGGEIYLPFHEEAWALGRELGIPVALHVVGTFGMQAVFDQLAEAGRFGPDNIFIHMTGMSDMAWKRVADAGSHISLSVPIEMQMRHGNPPLQQALDLGLQPSLSTDVECTMTADMFTQMRSAITLQRMLANDKALRGEEYPKLLSAIDVIRFATIEGARGLKLDHKTGTLTPGKEADIILLDANAINVAPLNHVPGAVVTLMERSNVSTVFCAGKIRKWHGTLLGHDIARLRSELEASRDFLLDAAGIRPDLF